MAFLKECACWGCRNDADISDIREEDQASAVRLCEACEAAGCDPFEQDVPCRCDEVEEPEAHFCPACGGEAQLLGVLGSLAHYRCRDCGIDSK